MLIPHCLAVCLGSDREGTSQTPRIWQLGENLTIPRKITSFPEERNCYDIKLYDHFIKVKEIGDADYLLKFITVGPELTHALSII